MSDSTVNELSPAQRGEAFTGSEQYAAGRMTHTIVTSQRFDQVQSEVVHDALMAAFQAGYLAAAAGTSVAELLQRMADIGTTGDHDTPAVTAWADGFGVWHVRVRDTVVSPLIAARRALRDELVPREGPGLSRDVWMHPERVPDMDTAGTVVYREGQPA